MATISTEVLQRAFPLMPTQGGIDPAALIRQVLEDFEVSRQIASTENDWKRQRVDAALEALEPLERAAVLLIRFHGMTCDELAARTGHSIEQIRSALANGLCICVRYLDR